MVNLGTVMVSATLAPDPVIHEFACPPKCELCLDACPVHALDDTTVNQKLCREISCFQHARGWDIYGCSKCRQVCPLRTGVQ